MGALATAIALCAVHVTLRTDGPDYALLQRARAVARGSRRRRVEKLVNDNYRARRLTSLHCGSVGTRALVRILLVASSDAARCYQGTRLRWIAGRRGWWR